MLNYKNTSTILIFSLLVIMTGCSEKHNRRWTEKEIEDFKCKCELTDTFNNIVILFKGFESNEFDSVLIKEFKDNTLLDSFKIYVFPSQSPYDIEHKERSGTINRTMNTKHKYEFILPGQRPYELANMKMILWSMYPGYGCKMGSFTLDGIKYQNNGNPEIRKWNFKPHAIQTMQGEWINKTDKFSSVEITDRWWIFEYKGEESGRYYLDVVKKLPQYVDTSVKSEFVVLWNKQDSLCFEILGLTDSSLSLMHFPSGKRSLYLRTK
jgi:hypothetical protein